MRTVEDALEDLAGEKPEARDTRIEDTWNVLVQVLLPLVLVLTFVIVTSILAYERSYRVLKGILGQNQKIPEVEARELKADLQLEKLLRALEKVKAEQRQVIGLTLFPTEERVRRDGTSIVDEDFRLLCSRARDRLGDGSDPALSAYANLLYAKVLVEAGVADPFGTEVRRWPEIVGNESDIEEMETVASSPGVITAANRRRIHTEILKFLSDLELEVADLQVALVDQIFKEILEKPGSTGDLDEEASRLLTRILDPAVPEEMRRRLAQELYRKILRHWHDQWDQDRYVFLDKSWAKLRS